MYAANGAVIPFKLLEFSISFNVNFYIQLFITDVQEPVDQECQQDKCELITISCKLSEKNKKGKWFVNNITKQYCLILKMIKT